MQTLNENDLVLTSRIRCKSCGDMIESTTRHHFVTCHCGQVSLDGGLDYMRILAPTSDDFINCSILAQTGIRLLTKDGRQIGNALLISWDAKKHTVNLLTDFGNYVQNVDVYCLNKWFYIEEKPIYIKGWFSGKIGRHKFIEQLAKDILGGDYGSRM